ncbi:MAG TPA: amino acid adenylation domain-containing protein [Pyrinomonadaceae bacterium]|nr:amino acid adenylation domain-containing protein [Pyrinomonadaceae bacterium]
MHFLDRIADLPPQKRALLSLKLNPMSFAQQRLWFLDQLDPGTSAYNLFTGYRLSGPLDVSALERSLSEIVRRHEVLRTNFAMIEGRLVQILNPPRPIELPLEDLSDVPESEREARLRQLANEEAQRPFDLARGTPIRATLVKLAPDEHVSLLTVHHIVFDGWSMGIFLQEMAVLYDAFSRGAASPLRDLPMQYGDFARWQRQTLQGARLEEILDYWKTQLRDVPPLLELPTDRPRTAMQSFTGTQMPFGLSPELSDSLRALSRQEDVTLFMLLLAAFKVVLWRYSGQENIVVATPVAGRDRSEIEGLIGFFVNTLVLHTDVSGNPTFRDLLKRVREVALGAYAHQDLPFEKLVEEIRPERDTSQNPLFQVMFTLQNVSAPTMETAPVQSAGLTMTRIDADSVTSQFDLTLGLIDRETDLVLWIEYNTHLFNRDRIERMSGHLRSLLAAVVENPDLRLSELPLLGETERQQLLSEWNQTGQTYSRDKCIHQLFEQQVENSPDAVAVIFGQHSMSYEELNTRANRLANHLRQLGVGPEVRVGLLAERSFDMVAGILAILKAGGAYVPIDPAYPADRMSFILSDANIQILLAQRHLAEKPGEHSAQVVLVDEFFNGPAHNPVNTAYPESNAVILYTSGSTGKPKGVVVQHRSLVNYVESAIASYELTANDCVLQFASIGFDTSAEEIFCPLSCGASLVLRTEDMLDSTTHFLERCTAFGISMLTLPTAYWHQLTASMSDRDWELAGRVRLWIGGGEAMLPQSVQEWQRRLGQRVRLINSYGPTEATIACTGYEVTEVEDLSQVPIGRPLTNAEAYILDKYLQPVPVGVYGELCIGGAGLTRGYLNRPGPTAEKFIPNPFNGTGERLYRTGDVARFLSDGNLEYFGRSDHQVKIRGFRIEIGEVEAVLGRHPALRESAVVVREIGSEKRLVAYVVPHASPGPSTSELREFVKAHVPEYMVPSIFMMLERLPLTSSGKIDRKALPAPDQSRPELAAKMVAPRNEVEQTLAEIWQSVLGLERVGIYDSFFELGGDSILSIQVVSRASQKGLRLTPKQIFLNQTIAELALVVETAGESKAEQGIVTGPVPLTPIQHLLFEQNFSDPHYYNQSALLEMHDRLNPVALESATRHLIEHHDGLRLRFTNDGRGWQQFNAGLEHTPFTNIDLSWLPGYQQSRTIEEISERLQRSLDLAEGPLVRIVLFELGSEEAQRLLLIFHHLVIDGVSWRVVVEDLQTALDQAQRGVPIVLPQKTTSFKEWATKLKQHAQSAEMKEEARLWQTTKHHNLQPLPVDFPFGENTEASSTSILVELSKAETQALLRDVPAAFHTEINDVLLAALVDALSEWTGSRTLLVDLEGHGREEIVPDVDLSRTVGWFTTIYPVLLDVSDAANVEEMLDAVKQQLRAVPNKGIGYGLLRYMSDDAEVFKSLPQAQVNFNYLGQFDQTVGQSSGFGPAPESTGPTRTAEGRRMHLLEINGGISDGELSLAWNYSQNLHHRSTIERIAQRYLESLRSIIEQAQPERVLELSYV